MKFEKVQSRLAEKLEQLLGNEYKYFIGLMFIDGTQTVLCDPTNPKYSHTEIEVGTDYVEVCTSGAGSHDVWKIYPFSAIKEIEYF